MVEVAGAEPMVLLERVWCPECGAEARRWSGRAGVVSLPAILTAAEVRAYLNGGLRKMTHDCGQPVFAEVSAIPVLSPEEN
jgi:hypothetical protein